MIIPSTNAYPLFYTAIKCFHRESHEKTVNNCIREDCNFEIEFVCLRISVSISNQSMKSTRICLQNAVKETFSVLDRNVRVKSRFDYISSHKLKALKHYTYIP